MTLIYQTLDSKVIEFKNYFDEGDLHKLESKWNSVNFEGVVGVFGLKHSGEYLALTPIKAEDFSKYLNDHKFGQLSWRDKLLDWINSLIANYTNYPLFKRIIEYGLSRIIRKSCTWLDWLRFWLNKSYLKN
jgi:hypothetical protein